MSSRFERHRPAGDRPASALSAPPIDDATDGERPWQTLVRRLRQLVESQRDAPGDDTKPRPKPELRLLPGGKTDEPEEQRSSAVIVRGRWQS
jgi:hypothetical protein